MNWLDFVIIILLIISTISGIANGLIKAFFSFAGFIVGIVLAGRFYVSLANHIGFISNEKAAQIVAFIFIMVVVLVIASILGWFFTNAISVTPLGIFNRLLGGVFGLVTGAIFIALVLALWAHYADPVGAISDSTLARFLLDKFPLVLNLLPNEFDTVRNFFQ